MKTLYSATVRPSVIGNWIEKIEEIFSCTCEFAVQDTERAHRKYQSGGYQSMRVTKEGIMWLDDWNAEVSFLEGDSFIELIGITTGGNIQSIRMEEAGRVTVVHKGRRGSTLGRIWDFVHEVMEDPSWPKEWVLEEYHSSQDEWWPVSCWIASPPWEDRLRPVAQWEAEEKNWLDELENEQVFFEKGNSGCRVVE
jgi:hypothetical protein